MEKLISSRSDLQVVPESYILPLETRPGNTQVSVLETIPVINFQQLGTDRPQLIKQIIDSRQRILPGLTFFLLSFISSRFHGIVFKYLFDTMQLINHGVPENWLHSVLDVANEFFELPSIDKASFCSEDPKQSCKLYTSNDDMGGKAHY